jgi:hypothetical protein
MADIEPSTMPRRQQAGLYPVALRMAVHIRHSYNSNFVDLWTFLALNGGRGGRVGVKTTFELLSFEPSAGL